jgi:hypothetical protein
VVLINNLLGLDFKSTIDSQHIWHIPLHSPTLISHLPTFLGASPLGYLAFLITVLALPYKI